MSKNGKATAKLIPHQDPEDRIPVGDPSKAIHDLALWRVYALACDVSGDACDVWFDVITDGPFVLPDANAAVGLLSGGQKSLGRIHSIKQIEGLMVERGRLEGGELGCVSQTAHPMSPTVAGAVASLMEVMASQGGLVDELQRRIAANDERPYEWPGVRIVWDEDHDERIKSFIDSVPTEMRERLIVAHEHEGMLYLVWDVQPPESYRQGCEVEIDSGTDDDGNPAVDYWTIQRSTDVHNLLR